MLQVQFRTTAAGPDGVFNAGKVYPMDAETARPFIEGGYAHAVRRADDGKTWTRVSPTVPAPVATAASAPAATHADESTPAAAAADESTPPKPAKKK